VIGDGRAATARFLCPGHCSGSQTSQGIIHRSAFIIFMAWTRFFRRRHWDRERSLEIDAHLEIETAENIARGMSPEEARWAAQRRFGNFTQVREEIYRMNSIGFLETFWQDLRYAGRMLRRNPGFTALAVLSLAIGIGGNAAMFSIVSAVLIQPLPYRDPGRLVDVPYYYPPGAIVAMQQWSRTMDLAAVTPDIRLNLTGQGEATRLAGNAVSANFFSVLGVGAQLGRTFRPGEDRPGKDNLVILSHAFWLDKFGDDPEIIGQMIMLGGIGRRVIGVMPPGFAFPDSTAQFWIPLHLDPRDVKGYWNVNFMPMIARLRPDATLQEAKSEIRQMNERVLNLFPYPMGRDFNSDATVIPLQTSLVQDVRSKLIILQGAIGLVLLIACVNVASLLLARATTRQKEMALRAALGAAPGRIVRQLLTESVALALAGGALGLALAFGAFSVLRLALPISTATWTNVHMGWQVLAFITALSIVTGLAFGLVPALSSKRIDLAGTMKTGGQRSAAGGGARLRSALIAGELALAVVLAVGAGLLIKSLWLLTGVNPGFQPQHVLTLRVSPDQSLCQQRAACIALYNQLVQRTEEIGGVSGVGAANAIPLEMLQTAYTPVDVEGHSLNPRQNVSPLFGAFAITPGYFHVLEIPILQGRAFANADNETSAPVVIVSAATARRYWPGRNPIGKHLRPVWDTRWRTVVGVAADVRQYDLTGRSPNYLSGVFYMPYPQSTDSDQELPLSMTLIVRTVADPVEVAGRIRDLVRDLNPNVPVSEVRTMKSLLSESTQQSHSLTWLFVSFAGVALLLAAIGAYGVVSYSTAQRTFEIGIRMALGATSGRIFAMVLGQSLRLVVVGLAVGVFASLALARMLMGFLYGVTAADPMTYLAVSALLVAIAVIAGFVPARRAAALDPLMALRSE
jgi:predicted permease